MEQLILHLVGDYVLQLDSMALNKKKKGLVGFVACVSHCLVYAMPFILITSIYGVLLIAVGHFIIDRWSLIDRIIALKNGNDYRDNWGMSPDRPQWIAFWLYVVQDNTIHLLWNYFIIKFMGS